MATYRPGAEHRGAARRWFSIVTLAVAVVLPGAAPASATFPGRDGLIAFGRDGQIWVGRFTATGYTERPITTDGAPRNARWSADGTRLAFNTRSGQIGVMAGNGSNRRILTSVRRSTKPAWSPRLPGGERIVFERARPGQRTDLWTVPAAGGAVRRLTSDGSANCGDTFPSWSPLGTHITYLRRHRGPDAACDTNDDQTRVVVLNLRTNTRRVLPPVDTWHYRTSPPSFSADGAGVEFLAVGETCFDNYMRYDLASGVQTRVLTESHCEGDPQISEAVPTPSGGILLLTGQPEDEQTLWCLRLSGGSGTCSTTGTWTSFDVQPIP